MGIRENSKKIILHFLSIAIECGDLTEYFPFQYAELAQVLSLKDEKYCRVCCQYLKRMGYIDIIRNRQSEDLEITLMAPAIDFLETT